MIHWPVTKIVAKYTVYRRWDSPTNIEFPFGVEQIISDELGSYWCF